MGDRKITAGVLADVQEDPRAFRFTMRMADGMQFRTGSGNYSINYGVTNHTNHLRSEECWVGRSVVLIGTKGGRVDDWRLATPEETGEAYSGPGLDTDPEAIAGEHSDRGWHVTHHVTVWLENDGKHADNARAVLAAGGLPGLRTYVRHVLDNPRRGSSAEATRRDLSDVDVESRVRWADVAHSLALG